MSSPPYVAASGLTSGTVASGQRSYPVTAPTSAGDTLLAVVGSNNASIAITALTDPRGNLWTLDREYTVGPYTEYFRCPGATGGPGGGPTAPLTPGDLLTLTASPTVAAQVGLLGVAVNVGAMDQPHVFTPTATLLTVQADITAPPGGTVIALNLNQGAGGVAAFDPPITTLASMTQGHQLSCGYLVDAPGGPVTVLARLATAAANSRLAVYSFLPVAVAKPLRAWGGTGWLDVVATGAKVWDGARRVTAQ